MEKGLEDRASPGKFAETFCSHCGGTFGPRDSGYSHCDQHAGLENRAIVNHKFTKWPFCKPEDLSLAEMEKFIDYEFVRAQDNNANTDLLNARTAEFHINREPVPEKPLRAVKNDYPGHYPAEGGPSQPETGE